MKDYLYIDNFLTKETCQELIDLSEKKGYDEADISYNTGAKMNKEYRNNSRCLYKDENLRLKLETLLSNHIPKTQMLIGEGGVVKHLPFLRLSGNFRFYKYLPGEEFKKHRDSNQIEEGGVSLITVLFYLNSAEEGGETGIYDYTLPEKLLVEAKEGRVLMFNHTVAHTGEKLVKGTKYVLRTDLIYDIV